MILSRSMLDFSKFLTGFKVGYLEGIYKGSDSLIHARAGSILLITAICAILQYVAGLSESGNVYRWLCAFDCEHSAFLSTVLLAATCFIVWFTYRAFLIVYSWIAPVLK